MHFSYIEKQVRERREANYLFDWRKVSRSVLHGPILMFFKPEYSLKNSIQSQIKGKRKGNFFVLLPSLLLKVCQRQEYKLRFSEKQPLHVKSHVKPYNF